MPCQPHVRVRLLRQPNMPGPVFDGMVTIAESPSGVFVAPGEAGVGRRWQGQRSPREPPARDPDAGPLGPGVDGIAR